MRPVCFVRFVCIPCEEAAALPRMGDELDPAETLTAEDRRDTLAAKKAAESVEVFITKEALLTRVLEFVGKSSLIMVEAPTSRKNRIASYIDVAFECASRVQRPDAVIVLVAMHDRFDLFGDVRTKIEQVFKPPW